MRAWLALVCLALPIVAHADPSIRVEERAGRVHARAWFPRSESPKRVELQIDDGPPVAANRVRLYADSDEPVDVVVLYLGALPWLGFDPHAGSIFSGRDADGAYRTLAEAFPLASFANLPQGSTVTALSYADDVQIELPTTPAGAVPRTLLRFHEEYEQRTTSHGMARGVSRALDILASTPVRRKVVLVIGDGVIEPESTTALRERAAREGVELQAIVWSRDEAPVYRLYELTGDVTWTYRLPQLGEAIVERIHALTMVHEASFPTSAFPLDGQVHQVALLLDGVLLHQQRLSMPVIATPPSTRDSLLSFGALVAALDLLLLLWFVSTRARQWATRSTLVLVVVGLARTAHADPEIEIDDTGVRAWFPRGQSPTRVELRIDEREPLVASSVIPYTDSDEAVDIVLLYCGSYDWIGTDHFEPVLFEGKPNITRLHGAYDTLVHTFATISLPRLPRGSTITVFSYAYDVVTELPTTSTTTVPPKLIRRQSDYRSRYPSDGAGPGLARALDTLESSSARRKVILLLGDGEIEVDRIAGLRDRARRASVEIQALLWRGPISLEDVAIDQLTSDVTRVRRLEDYGAAVSSRIRALSSPYEARFPLDAMPLDGSTHRVELLVDGVVVRDKLLTMPHVAAPPRPAHEPMRIALVVLLLANVLLLAWLAIRQISGR